MTEEQKAAYVWVPMSIIEHATKRGSEHEVKQSITTMKRKFISMIMLLIVCTMFPFCNGIWVGVGIYNIIIFSLLVQADLRQ